MHQTSNILLPMPHPPRQKHSTGEKKKGKYRPEFKVSAAEKAIMRPMYGLDDKCSAIVYERLMDCHHTSDMRTQALMFLRLFMLGGWRLNVVKPFVSNKILFGMLPHQERQWGIQQCTVLLPAIMGPPGPSIHTGFTQAQPQFSTPFSQSQEGFHGNSYHMYSSEIQDIIAHATATQKKKFHMGRENRVNIDRSSNYQWQKKIECEPCVD